MGEKGNKTGDQEGQKETLCSVSIITIVLIIEGILYIYIIIKYYTFIMYTLLYIDYIYTLRLSKNNKRKINIFCLQFLVSLWKMNER